MQEIPIEERLSQRKVVETLESAIYSLKILKPDGAIVHCRTNALFGLTGHRRIAKKQHPDDILFEDYRTTSPEIYGILIKCLEVTNTILPYKI